VRRRVDLALALVLLVPGVVFLTNAGNLREYGSPAAPPGQLLYALSRAIGLYALTFVWLQVLLGAFRDIAGSWLGAADVLRMHRSLGVFVVLTAVTHVVLFLAAVALRSDAGQAVELLLPRAGAGYYRRMLALGALGLYALFAAWAATSLRRWSSLRGWSQRIHWAAYAALFLVLLHSLAIGSETRLEPLRALCSVYFLTGSAAVLWSRVWSPRSVGRVGTEP
jgi:predicted ferric reductase